MTDSKDDGAIAARLLELEDVLRSRGIIVPSANVKTNDELQDVSDVESNAPRTMGMPARAKSNAKAKGKKARGRRASYVNRGRQPVMDRSDRALCRIMHSYGKTYQEIAGVVNQTVTIVAGAIKNVYLRPDDTGADYDFVDGQTKKMYPPIPSPTPGKRTRGVASAEQLPAKKQKDISFDAKPTMSVVTVEIPCDQGSISQSSSKKDTNPVQEFLCELDMDALYPKLQEAGVNDKFFAEFQSWTEKAAGELLEDFVIAGIMNRVQAFKIRKALARTQEGL